ncbi:phosphohexomutase domain-containing protein [Phycisphaera mikurensis]|uniref:Putative phosphoglucomutase/phosphomannomutase n=1 Tax=Phycisphaera mikurensis (strain NBRC 102666 / KCTC 22515 / FYK2301M01) TaxID=1142394 RepID=I0II09_PHYMF|nr:putative phosphoglucomutase/phosphomannomutase [Phycisphaera mikurensis]MBB6442539.1 phosphomannomutase [Phycisphaera mikurensis]BAM04897.1 putative phosphoglucomutase/phosphomannomutase [Phycisphaera mikurensis NBRC 102666]
MSHDAPADASPSPLMLGVSGMRGIVGGSLTEAVVARYAAAVGRWLAGERGTDRPLVVVGRDSRPSGAAFEEAAVRGLHAAGCRVRRVGILSTPGVAVALQAAGADGGLVLTASHNPSPWNGVKPLRHDGVAPPPDAVAGIVADFHGAAAPAADAAGEDVRDGGAAQRHVDAVLATVPANERAAVRAAGFRVVVDCVAGAGGAEAALLLAALGVEAELLHREPTGDFPHDPEPVAANLTGLCEAVREGGAAAGFALDPDADRLALVDAGGRFVGEEYTLVIGAMALLEPGGAVAANLSTSRMIDHVAEAVGGRVVRSPVGEANVAAAMRREGARVGGEGNGGIIDARVSQVRDSVVGMAATLRRMARENASLADLVARVPAYAVVKTKQPVGGVPGGVAGFLGAAERRVTEGEPAAVVDRQDGVRVDLPRGWVHVRPSNTEPVVRVIAEAEDREVAGALVALAGG